MPVPSSVPSSLPGSPSASPLFSLAGRTLVVVGTGAGIGVASARLLAQAGADVACLDVDQSMAEAAATQVDASGTHGSAHQLDVTDRDAVRRVITAVREEHGRIDGVLNVVGRSLSTPAAELPDEDWRRQLDINLTHHLVMAQEALPHLVENRGSYVAVASIAGLRAAPDMVTYGVSKAGLMSLMRTLAVEHGPQGVRFNSIAPGLVVTPHAEEIGFTTGPLGQQFIAHTPLRSYASPDDIAAAAYFLLSDLSRFVTGQTLIVDGGATANHPLKAVTL